MHQCNKNISLKYNFLTFQINQKAYKSTKNKKFNDIWAIFLKWIQGEQKFQNIRIICQNYAKFTKNFVIKFRKDCQKTDADGPVAQLGRALAF